MHRSGPSYFEEKQKKTAEGELRLNVKYWEQTSRTENFIFIVWILECFKNKIRTVDGEFLFNLVCSVCARDMKQYALENNKRKEIFHKHRK